MDDKPGLLVVMAHPDDESMGCGGLILRHTRAGIPVHLICATRGEAGWGGKPAGARKEDLPQIRTAELEAAAAALAISGVELWDYPDGGVDKRDPQEITQKIWEQITRLRPKAVIGWGPDGVYGHPDHIKAHYVTNAALDLLQREGWEPKKLYYTAIPRSMMEEFMKQMPEEAAQQQNTNMRIAGTPDELVTARIDVHDYVEDKRKAFGAHSSQNDPNSWFTTMASQIYELAFGTEYYQLVRGNPGSSLPEDDLFAGID